MAESFPNFDALPDGWSWAKLGDVCKTTSGGTPSRKSAEYFTGDIPWVKSGELPDGFVTEVEERITEDAVANSSAKLFPAGTLLIALYGATVGKLGILKEDATTNQAVCAIFPPEDLDTKYLFWYLRFVRSDLVAQAVGGAQPNISQGILRELQVPIAPPNQQKRIVAEIEKQFSRLDEAVANLKRVKANLKRYKAAVLKAAVEGRLIETEAELARREGRSYETGEQLLQRILETRRSQWQGKGKYKEPAAPDTTDLPELPEGWVWATYALIGEVTTGFTPPTADTENFGGDIPFFKPTDLDAGERVVLAREYLSEKAAKGRLLPAGSVLVTCIGATIGKTGLARVNCATNQQINAVTPDGNLVNSEFVYAWTVSPNGYKQILDNSSATTLPILNKSKFEALGIPLPPLLEQHRIVAEVDRRLSLLRETEAQVDANLQRAGRLRQTVLRKAFSA